MMERFVISDTHFGHENAVSKFKRPDGSPLRDFASAEECDEAMVERWNEVVKENDTVYHLGDVVIGRRYLPTVKRLNGRKILIRGNHDLFKDKDYYEVGFESLRGVHVTMGKRGARWIMTHVPIHPDSIARFRVNVHGHTHANQVMRRCEFPEQRHTMEPDPRYLCVSVEHTDFRPLHFDEVEERIQQRWEQYGYEDSETAFGNGSGPN